VTIARSVDELCRHPHALTYSQDGALDDGADLQFPRNIPERLPDSLVLHDRCAGNHGERPDFGQVRDQRIRHSVREIFLRRIAREVLERKHRNKLKRTRFAPEPG